MNHCRNALMLMQLWAIIAICGARLDGGEIVSADLDGFRTHVAPLLEKYCIDCHGGDEPEGKFSLEQIDADLLSGSDVEAWRMVDDQVRFGDMPPSDADHPSANQRQSLLDWIRQELLKTQLPGVVADEKMLLPQFGNYFDHHALFDERRSHVTPAPPRIWRLRPDIYSSLAGRLAERPTGLSNALNLLDGSDFKDYSTLYFLDEASTQQLLGNAKIIAATQVGPNSRDAVFKRLVSDDGPPDQATVASAIEAAFRRALSRGPTSEEKARFAAFYHQSADIGGYKTAAKAMLTAVILQPEFVFRQELGEGPPDEFGRVRLSQREIAYALSYALSDSPLGEFTTAADQHKLATREQVAAVVGRQLGDDSFAHDKNPRLIQFFREYFNYPFASEVFKDQPEGGTHSPGELVSDLEITLREILKRDEQVLAQLLTTREYYVGVQYGRKQTANQLIQRPDRSRKYPTAFSLPLDWKWSSHLQPVSFPKEERAGVLTHPAWLAAWSGNFDNHPVQRGKWIRTHLLGGTVPDVPIGVDARVPEKEHTTFRDRLAMAVGKAECWRCHKRMDPLGVPLERYDHYGRLQRLDAGQPVDVSGEIARTPFPELHGKVASPIEMIERLAQSPRVEQVFVRHVFRFLLGRNETVGDANTLQDAHQAYRDSNGSFNALVASILASDSFLYRQTSTTAQVDTAQINTKEN